MAVISKRRSRREAVAFFLGWNISDVETYQPGRTRVAVFTAGESYFVALRQHEKPPTGFGSWRAVGESHGYRIERADPE